MSYNNEYDEYQEVKDYVKGEFLEETREVKTIEEMISINFKKSMLEELFYDVLTHSCEGIKETIKTAIIMDIKKELIEDNFDKTLKEELRASIKEQTDKLLVNFMDREITVSNGYYEEKTIKCRELIEKDIENFMKKDLKVNFESTIELLFDRSTKKKIENYKEELRREVKTKIDDMFNQTTRDALSDQLFYILSQNETYKKLSSSINGLIEEK